MDKSMVLVLMPTVNCCT